MKKKFVLALAIVAIPTAIYAATVIEIKEKGVLTIVKCSKGNDTKIRHNNDGSCTDNYAFGSYTCPYVMKKAIKRCENR